MITEIQESCKCATGAEVFAFAGIPLIVLCIFMTIAFVQDLIERNKRSKQ